MLRVSSLKPDLEPESVMLVHEACSREESEIVPSSQRQNGTRNSRHGTCIMALILILALSLNYSCVAPET